MPTTPTRCVGLMSKFRNGEKTVMPPHSKGPALAASKPSGMGAVHNQWARTRSAKPPWWPMMVGWAVRHNWCSPPKQTWQCMQLDAFQPMPTRCPSFKPWARSPKATTRPMTSWPATTGYGAAPHSLSITDRSEWHKPQCSTATSTSSAPRGPNSKV